MMARHARLVIPFVLSTLACPALHAQSTPATQFTVGAKIWHASWLSYIPAAYTGVGANGAPAVGDSVNAVEGSEHTDVLPLLALRHGKFFASASYGRFKSDFTVLTSPVILPTNQTLITTRTDHFKRRESDVNLGYWLTPNLGLSLGYKDATETRDTTLGVAPQRTPLLETRVKGWLVGAVAGFPVYDRLSLYAQAGYGPARLRLDFEDPALGNSRAKGRYLIGELGLSYSLYSDRQTQRGATAAIGYRTQTVKTDSYASIFQQNRDLRDVREGLVLSLNVTL